LHLMRMTESRDLRRRSMSDLVGTRKPDILASPQACIRHVRAHLTVFLSLRAATRADARLNALLMLSLQSARVFPCARKPTQDRGRMPLHRDLPLTMHRDAV